MSEETRIEDGYAELPREAEARIYQGMLYIRQDAPAMENDETICLDAKGAMQLLDLLYKRRYALYQATTLSLGADDMPAWIASGRPGNVVIDAADPGQVEDTAEQRARAAVIKWAQSYYVLEQDDPIPEVEVIRINYDKSADEWEAELSVSTCADNPYVTFWIDERQKIKVSQVEY